MSARRTCTSTFTARLRSSIGTAWTKNAPAGTLAILNLYDLADINTDIVGTVYGRYLLEGKHEQGRYYTPKWLVERMLDTAGWKTGAVAGRRLADLSCGSGWLLGGSLPPPCRELPQPNDKANTPQQARRGDPKGSAVDLRHRHQSFCVLFGHLFPIQAWTLFDRRASRTSP